MLRLARPGLLAAAASAALLPACFYTGSIVERPRVEIEKVTPGTAFYPGDTIELDAVKHGGDPGSVSSCDWHSSICPRGAGECQPDPDNDGASGVAPGFHYRIQVPPGHQPMEVTLVCRDQGDVVSGDSLDIEIGNRPPELTVQVDPGGDSHVVTTPVQVVVAVEDPDLGDSPTLSWRYDSPRASDPNQVVFEPVDQTGLAYQLIPDVAGLWQVDITADDGVDDQGVATAEQPIVVDADQPPCIAITSPAADPDHRFVLRRDDGPRTLAVLAVSDDLDPYPTPPGGSDILGAPGFTWQLADPATGGALEPVSGAGAAELTIDPAGYAPGDQLDVRVEVTDRVARTLPCAGDQPTCSIGGDGCLERVTWGIEIR